MCSLPHVELGGGVRPPQSSPKQQWLSAVMMVGREDAIGVKDTFEVLSWVMLAVSVALLSRQLVSLTGLSTKHKPLLFFSLSGRVALGKAKCMG